LIGMEGGTPHVDPALLLGRRVVVDWEGRGLLHSPGLTLVSPSAHVLRTAQYTGNSRAARLESVTYHSLPAKGHSQPRPVLGSHAACIALRCTARPARSRDTRSCRDAAGGHADDASWHGDDAGSEGRASLTTLNRTTTGSRMKASAIAPAHQPEKCPLCRTTSSYRPVQRGPGWASRRA
jgi:hypothetical protein